tara:strand:- start:535 stop:2412 length:1878 start_codon:yes stop_codon:yes gene_type:complete
MKKLIIQSFSYISILSALALSIIAIYASGFALIDPKFHRALCCALALITIVLLPYRKIENSIKFLISRITLDFLIIVFGILTVLKFYDVQYILENELYDVTYFDGLYSIVGLGIFIEVCRRSWGYALFFVGVFAVIYLYFGSHFPSFLQHSGFNERLIGENLWYNMNKGVFGTITNIAVNTVFIFILFGVLLEGTGAGHTLLKFAFILTRRTRGGPAQAAILASSMFGTMSGSVVANIVGTGTFTIPMIKKRGFTPTFAGGIEATASSGGQIMPPIMGAAALVMADLTGINYLSIALAALIPALLYYFSLFSSVTMEARKQNIEIKELDIDSRITVRDWINSILFVVPIFLVIFSLLFGSSTSRAGFYAVISILVLSFINPEIRKNPVKLLNSVIKGGTQGAKLLIAIVVISMLVGAIDSTGIGIKLASFMNELRGDSLFLSLTLAMIGALVLGMGMPTLPAYLIIIVVMGPALQNLGVSVLIAHLFVFYYGVASSLTPPVALAAYAAAPIAGSNPIITSLMAFRLGIAKFIIPFAFAYYPCLLIIENFSWLEFFSIVPRLLISIWFINSALAKFDFTKLSWAEVILRLSVGFGILFMDVRIQIICLILGSVLLVWDFLRHKRSI